MQKEILDANTHTSPQLEQKLRRASFAMVSRGPDMTLLLLLRMYYVSYTLLCTYKSPGNMHATSLHTLIC